MINYLTSVVPLAVQTSPPKLSKSDRERIVKALSALADADCRYAEIEAIRDHIRTAARSYADGSVNLRESIAMAAIEGARVNEVRGALRSGCRAYVNEIVSDVNDIVLRHREHQADELAKKCQAMEFNERRNAREIGIHDDDFRASGLLERLREQHARTKRQVSGNVSRADISAVAKAVGIVIPTPPEVDPLSALEADIDLDGEEVGSGLLE